MSKWRRPRHVDLRDRADTLPNRTLVCRALSSGLPAAYEATDELCVMLTYVHLKSHPRVARSYGRKVVWFRADDQKQWSGDLVYVGDAGHGRGWRDRMVALFRMAMHSWAEHQIKNGWGLE